jgi:hypothetical protein
VQRNGNFDRTIVYKKKRVVANQVLRSSARARQAGRAMAAFSSNCAHVVRFELLKARRKQGHVPSRLIDLMQHFMIKQLRFETLMWRGWHSAPVFHRRVSFLSSYFQECVLDYIFIDAF